MAIRKIKKFGEEVLNKKCRYVDKINDRILTLLDDLLDTMYEANGVGLAAPQVGVLRRVVVIDIGDGPLELINPEIIASEGEQSGSEGCLSYPGKYGLVTRPEKVTVRAQDRSGEWREINGEGLLARAFCHEIDHLDGHLFRELVEHWYTEEELEQL